MRSKLLGCVSAALLGAAIALPTPATAGGGFGGGGMHGGFGGGGMHFGGGGMHFGGGFHRPMFSGRSVFAPGRGRFDRDDRFGRFGRFDRDDRFFFRHRRFRNNFFFAGAPFSLGYDYGYDGCWRQIWTGYGYQWTNVCNDYGYYGY